ncbi:MAG: AraC family transcriptional regulator ligand-binding domain-containing protein, partial [Perlucidibaca sp.]
MERPTVAAHFVLLLMDYCRLHDLPAGRLLAEAGLPAQALDDVDARLAFSDYSHMLDCATEMLADDNLGLRLGTLVRPGNYGAHGLSLLACPSIRELVPRMVRYAALVHDACRDEVEERGDEWILHWRSNLAGNADPGRHHSELNFAATVAMARWMTGRDITPLWVSFRHPEPK